MANLHLSASQLDRLSGRPELQLGPSSFDELNDPWHPPCVCLRCDAAYGWSDLRSVQPLRQVS